MIRATKVMIVCAAALVLSAGTALYAEEDKGTIKSVHPDKKEVILKGAVQNHTYDMGDNMFMSLDGLKCKLQDFKEGDRALVVYEKKGDRMVASSIRALRNSQETSGTVRTAFSEKRQVVLKGVTSDTTYELEKDGLVWLNGKQSSLADLREGDSVVVTYQRRGDNHFATSVIASRR